MGKKFKKVEIISRAPNRKISLVPCILDGMLEKLCLKPEQQTGKLLDIWGKKKIHVITGRVKLSLPQISQLLYPVHWLMKT